MEKVKKAGGNLSNGFWGEQIGGREISQESAEASNEIKMTNDKVKNTITCDELRKHNTADSAWCVIQGEVYDGTPYLKEHPGGAQSIISAAGALDSTDEFLAIRESKIRVLVKTITNSYQTARLLKP